jgi:putative ABC transport system permease protein
VMLLSKDFSRLIAVAFVIACPVAWYAVHTWLNNFAFHVEISWLVFVIVGLVTLLIALLTISYRALQAAFANPVKTLRHE